LGNFSPAVNLEEALKAQERKRALREALDMSKAASSAGRGESDNPPPATGPPSLQVLDEVREERL